MAKGAKMAGASQGTAQQRAFTQEVSEKKGERAAQILKWLTYLFNTGTHTHTRLKPTGMQSNPAIEDVINFLQSNKYTRVVHSTVFAEY